MERLFLPHESTGLRGFWPIPRRDLNPHRNGLLKQAPIGRQRKQTPLRYRGWCKATDLDRGRRSSVKEKSNIDGVLAAHVEPAAPPDMQL